MQIDSQAPSILNLIMYCCEGIIPTCILASTYCTYVPCTVMGINNLYNYDMAKFENLSMNMILWKMHKPDHLHTRSQPGWICQ